MKQAFIKILHVITELRHIGPDMPIQTAATFLSVANEEGITMKRLSEKLGISQSSVSRNVAALSKTHRLNKPGYDLLYAMEDPTERRRKIVRLTPKGRLLADKIAQCIED
ncbi:MarR family transcriptional regulator [Oceanospirillum sp. HFRX-1_2]